MSLFKAKRPRNESCFVVTTEILLTVIFWKCWYRRRFQMILQNSSVENHGSILSLKTVNKYGLTSVVMLPDTSLLVYLHNRNNPNSRSAPRSELLLGGAGRSSTCRRSLGLNERNGCVTGCLIPPPPTRPSADSWCRPVLWLCCPAEESDGDH